VKASIAGAIVANTLFNLGASFLLGGLKHHVQTSTRPEPASSPACCSWHRALLVPSAIAGADSPEVRDFRAAERRPRVLLIAAYGLGLLFSLKTHREFFASAAHGDDAATPWPMGLALATLAGVTVLVALVSEIFVESVQGAALEIGMTPAFVGFVVVPSWAGPPRWRRLLRGAQEPAGPERRHRPRQRVADRALRRAVLVLLSYVLGPSPMGLQFWPGAVVMMLIATMTRRCSRAAAARRGSSGSCC